MPIFSHEQSKQTLIDKIPKKVYQEIYKGTLIPLQQQIMEAAPETIENLLKETLTQPLSDNDKLRVCLSMAYGNTALSDEQLVQSMDMLSLSPGKQLFIVAILNKTNLFDRLINRQIEAYAPENLQAVIATDNYGAFRWAVHNHCLDIMNHLIKVCSPEHLQEMITVTGRTKTNGTTPLHIASHHGYLDVVNQLILAGANLNQAGPRDITPLYIAIYQGHLDIVNKLIEAGANINQEAQDGATLLYIAANSGHLAVVNKLIEIGANINQENKDGTTPVLVAVCERHFDIIKKLIGSGANINQGNKDGITPLFTAAYQGSIDVVSMLLDAGADINQKTHDSIPPLHIAAKQGHLEVVKYLATHPNISYWSMMKLTEVAVPVSKRQSIAEIQNTYLETIKPFITIFTEEVMPEQLKKLKLPGSVKIQCYITHELMREPFYCSIDKHYYEAAAIQKWLTTGHDSSPLTRQKITPESLSRSTKMETLIQNCVEYIEKCTFNAALDKKSWPDLEEKKSLTKDEMRAIRIKMLDKDALSSQKNDESGAAAEEEPSGNEPRTKP